MTVNLNYFVLVHNMLSSMFGRNKCARLRLICLRIILPVLLHQSSGLQTVQFLATRLISLQVRNSWFVLIPIDLVLYASYLLSQEISSVGIFIFSQNFAGSHTRKTSGYNMRGNIFFILICSTKELGRIIVKCSVSVYAASLCFIIIK